ncbi:sigma-70 family RNA polymerase sigma factor [Fulvivirgaceae bacterium BMA12]|uniref:Sigma-70 family RNA polymerase sigma factor n=1 Tax=Agaribacillus aureus TaxID=3051825 RepID=A0ABT8L7L5_9BACT|nr:sigma-70 family RNA polymerase sigma factor [Fulvivirgaceae bacterium BMA12]
MDLNVNNNINVKGDSSEFFFSAKAETAKESVIEKKWLSFVAGRKSDFEFIYQSYHQHLFNYGMHLCSDRELVKDCIQDAFVTLVKNKNDIKKAASIKFYLFKCFKRKIINSIKKKRDLTLHQADVSRDNFMLGVTNQFHEIEETLSADLKKQLKDTINALPNAQREAIILYFYEGMDYKQIAVLMNMTRVKSARALIYRALSSISQKLNPA